MAALLRRPRLLWQSLLIRRVHMGAVLDDDEGFCSKPIIARYCEGFFGTAFDSTWHSVVFRRNGTNFNIFVDGGRGD